ncbi:MAG: hypothetical protein J7M14_04805 [Planctomycetes bacterium]|nr:hypothetical protein [Planctomycetota bacterium]
MVRKGKKYRRPESDAVIASKLSRAPRVDLKVGIDQLDRRVFAAVDAVTGALAARLEASLSISQVRLLTTRIDLLEAMKGTHRSVRRLVSRNEDDCDLAPTVDALPLTRVQLERCFLGLLLADNPDRWHGRYRKNAWKAFAEKFFRDREAVGHFDEYADYFAPDGRGILALRAFAHEMDVSEDELQTLRAQVLGDKERDPRWKRWYIADMPTPGKCLTELKSLTWKALARLLYPYYDNLSHFSHSGMVGVMQAAILRKTPEQLSAALAQAPGADQAPPAAFDKEQFWSSAVGETTLPRSYASMMFVATLFGREVLDTAAVRRDLLEGWRPYVCDAVPMGMAIWDAWARKTLLAEVPGES